MKKHRKWRPLKTPAEWMRDGQRVVWHFDMACYAGLPGEPGVIDGEPYQIGSGEWLVRVALDKGRTVRACIEALDKVAAP